MSALRLALVAGEASGDNLGGELVSALRRRVPEAQIAGVAGPQMMAAGCTPWWRIEALSVMGVAEVALHLPRLYRLYRRLLARLSAFRPHCFIGIDAPDFNLRLARRLRATGIPTCQYVSPTVWAWRTGRIETVRQACDRVLSIFPFEEALYAEHGVRARFVGHPLADRLTGPEPPARARQALGLAPEQPVLTVLPGSRHSEVARLGPVFARAAERCRAAHPDLQLVTAPASEALAADFSRALPAAIHGEHRRSEDKRGEDWVTVPGRAHEAIAAADVTLVASGTASLECLLLGCPMVVGYRVAALTYLLLVGTGLMRIPHVAMPNILAGEELVPELIQDALTPQALSERLLALLEDTDARRRLSARFAAIAGQLRCNASERAADEILALIEERSGNDG